jgi:L,D-transpeptidase-like protein/putative peptidoglycan binding protein/sporulation and spore germination protein
MLMARSAFALLLLATVLTSSATASHGAAPLKVAFLQGEQVVYVDRAGSSLAQAMTALLAGPTKSEAARKITTQTPSGTPLRAVSITNRVATIDLGEKFANGTRFDSLSARVVQVVLTATRFPNVRAVRLLVKGGTPLGLFPGFVTNHPLTAKSVLAPDQPPPTAPAAPPPGAESDETRALQQSLADLGFMNPGEVDGRTGARTTSAVVAFQKWAGLGRDGVAGEQTRAALTSAARPSPVGSGSGHRVEVLLDRQLTLVIDGNRVTRVLDVTTGKPGFATPTGSYRVFRKEVRSWSVPYKVWLPWASYFVGGVAFHEYPDVPPTPASHGCVRVPRWDAQWLYTQTPSGTPVTVIARSR